jgi:hypothetical protein
VTDWSPSQAYSETAYSETDSETDSPHLLDLRTEGLNLARGNFWSGTL